MFVDARDREKWKVMIAILCQMYNKYEAFNVNEELCCSFMDCLSGSVATSRLLKKPWLIYWECLAYVIIVI